MDVLSLLLVIIVFAVIFWIVNALIPMEASAKRVINAVVALILVLWLLSVLFPGFLHLRVGS